ncbi:hypothetical protein MNBD_GAMMA01-1443 [hydrothermal vent metagenome]|uniref:OmpR/PhoB-type domain-containing protein n=1 Tax=hydrothermal vent metagenome TaxID=652676 RepID=A0A3B0VTG2_9ZZZZ
MRYKFNNIEIDTEKFSLLTNGKEIAVEPQVFNLIVYLIEHKNKIVSRDEILDNIWKGRVVSDTSINNHIKSVRKVLGDDGHKQQIIKTIHSRGYQFIAEMVDDNNTVKTKESTFKPKKFRSNILVLAVIILLVLLVLFATKYYQSVELRQSVQKIANYQEISYATFIAQAKRRDELVDMIESRIGEKREMQFEKYFSYYFKKLNGQELFVFDQIRAMTDIGLYQNNLKILNELNNHPEIYKQIKGTKELHQHLTFWINKYHSIFKQRADMCLLYVGVEDGVPYPNDVNQNIKDWIQGHTAKITQENNQTSQPEIAVSKIQTVTDDEISQASTIRSLAVLPLINLSPGKETNFLGFALTDQIISKLLYNRNIQAKSSTFVRKFDQNVVDPIAIGKQLKVEYILSGNYLKQDNVVRLNFELAEVETKELIWRESQELPYENLFKLQDSIANTLAQKLDLGLTSREYYFNKSQQPMDAIAYDYYLRSIAFPRTKDGNEQALELLQKAFTIESNSAPIYTQMASRFRWGFADEKGTKKAEKYLMKALEINPRYFTALRNLSMIYYDTGEFLSAYKIVKKMLIINPGHAATYFTLGKIYRKSGMVEESIKMYEKSLELEYSTNTRNQIGASLFSNSQYKEASKYFSPESVNAPSLSWRGSIALRLGEKNKALLLYQKIIVLYPDSYWGRDAVIFTAIVNGDKEIGLHELKLQEKRFQGISEPTYFIASQYAAFGEKQDALRLYEKAVKDGYYNLSMMLSDPFFDFVRNDAKYIEIFNLAQQNHLAFKQAIANDL